MEVYVGPRDAIPVNTLSRAQVLAALVDAGVKVARTEERDAPSPLRAWWILFFDGSEATLQFQETAEGLSFATLDHSAFDNTNLPDRICTALESLGWEVDQENIG